MSRSKREYRSVQISWKVISVICFVFVVSTDCISAFEEDGGFSQNTDAQPSSYFELLNDARFKLGHLQDPENVHNLTTISLNLFHVYRRLANLIYDDADEIETRTSTGTKYDNSKIIEKRKKIIENLHKMMANNGVKKVPSTCVRDIEMILKGLFQKETWALQFFDAMGKPGPSLMEYRFTWIGNFDQCRAAAPVNVTDESGNEIKFEGEYFTLTAPLVKFPINLVLGACLPKTCSDPEVSLLINQIIFEVMPPNVFKYAYPSRNGTPTKMTDATKAAISLLSIIALFIVSGTVFDLLFIQLPKWTKSDIDNTKTIEREVANGYHDPSTSVPGQTHSNVVNVSMDEKSPLLKSTSSSNNGAVVKSQDSQAHGVLAQILLSFSVYSNGKKILNTQQAPGSLGSIHGIRFLSMSWVVLCHLFAFSTSFTLNFATAMPEYYHRWTFLPISNGFVSVDTFFTLSGLLTSYLTIKEMMRRKTWKINWLMFYFHRFWRLTPPYMMALLIYLGLQQYMGQGPLWSPVQPYDRDNCENNWWTNLLYINNLVKMSKGCFGHSWYLANDMQFFVLSPLMIIPFFFHRIAGVVSCAMILLISTITTGALSTVHKWAPTESTLKLPANRGSQAHWMEHYYVVPWCRIGPFIVGIVAGYILAKTKGRPFKMPWWLVSFGWTTSVASGLAIVYGLYGDVVGDHPSTIPTAAFYNAVNRTVWGVCVSWVIIACSAGYGGPVNKLLSWSPFVVLGRLTYMSYLIHLNLLYVFYQNLDNLFTSNDTTIVVFYLGMLLFVNMAAFVCVLVLESPMLGLEKALLKR